MNKIHPMLGKILVKKVDVQQEASGFLLNNETEKFLSCGELPDTVSFFMSNPAVSSKEFDPIEVVLQKGTKVYYQKSKGYDTHDPDYQVVNISDIIYTEDANE